MVLVTSRPLGRLLQWRLDKLNVQLDEDQLRRLLDSQEAVISVINFIHRCYCPMGLRSNRHESSLNMDSTKCCAKDISTTVASTLHHVAAVFMLFLIRRLKKQPGLTKIRGLIA